MLKKPVVRIVVVLSVLSLAGVLALSASSHRTVVTSQDGRLAIATKPASHFTPAAQPPVGLATLSGNLSKYPFGVYFCCYGYTISGPDSFLGSAYWIGIPYTPSSNVTIKEFDASVGWGGAGADGAHLSLNADAGGVPGAEIAGLDVSNLGNFGSCCTVATAKGPGFHATAGTTYWVVVSTSAAQSTTFDAWAFNSTDMRETYSYAAYSTANGWTPAEGLLPGYAILGQ